MLRNLIANEHGGVVDFILVLAERKHRRYFVGALNPAALFRQSVARKPVLLGTPPESWLHMCVTYERREQHFSSAPPCAVPVLTELRIHGIVGVYVTCVEACGVREGRVGSNG